MTREAYQVWRAKNSSSRAATYFRGSRDPIVIMAIPTGRECDGYMEGFVVESQTPQYPVGYCSLAWQCEAFDEVQGTVQFQAA